MIMKTEMARHLREGYRDDDVVQCDVLVLEFILDADFACSIIGRRWPAVNYNQILSKAS